MYCKVPGDNRHVVKPASHLRTSIWRLSVVLVLATLTALLTATLESSPAPLPMRDPLPTRLDVLALRAVPEGHYLLNLQAHGPERWLNLHVTNGVASCVNASDAALKGLRGDFQLVGNGVFLIFLANQSHRASQFWIFQPDGTAQVKEITDRGEKQVARPVPDDSLAGAGDSAPPH